MNKLGSRHKSGVSKDVHKGLSKSLTALNDLLLDLGLILADIGGLLI